MKKQVFGTKEWAASNLNLRQTGCEHGCKYCYAAAMAIRFGRATPESWCRPVLIGQPKFGKRAGTIMMPTTHDITESNVDEFVVMANKALDLGNSILIVTKPRASVIAFLVGRIPSQHKDKVLFRLTIGSADNAVLRLWEPGASLFEERLETLGFLHAIGYKTSVSSEPMLDADIHKVVEATAPYITDAIWLGKANSLLSRVSMNTDNDPEWMRRAEALNGIWTDDAVLRLYARYKNDPKVKWKESIKKIVGLEIPTEAGMDA